MKKEGEKEELKAREKIKNGQQQVNCVSATDEEEKCTWIKRRRGEEEEEDGFCLKGGRRRRWL